MGLSLSSVLNSTVRLDTHHHGWPRHFQIAVGPLAHVYLIRADFDVHVSLVCSLVHANDMAWFML